MITHERVGAVALAHDVLVGPEIHDLHRQAQERRPLLIGERGDALHLADERVGSGMKGVHDGAPLVAAGARGLSVVSACDRMAGDVKNISHK
jgi:hypothetical protein